MDPVTATAVSPLTSIVIVFVVVVVITAIAFSVYTILFPVQTAADRLEQLTAAAETGEVQVDITGLRDPTPLELIAARLGALAQSRGDQIDADTEKLIKALKHAGYKNRRALDIFLGTRVAGALLLPVAISPIAFVMEIQAVAFAMVIAMAIGYYAPLIVLTNQAQNRQGELLRSFPDALDLLVSSVESGLSLDQAFRRVAHEMRTVAPGLAREFTFVNSEISAGVERLIALRHLEERTGLEEVRSLVNMLAQSERFGSSIADSLRVYSHVAREKRMSRAEELAGQVGSKLTIVMIIFFLPVLMLILLVPSVIRMFFEG
ncbi:MAG: type II secretion system F family protein [Alphaproteobacteria bacterium]|nr:type II secretion system F family protein [Alphaproteobacteria bacterium]